MSSPFPGMDPYLEDANLWPAFHHQLVLGLYQILLPGLVDRYRAQIMPRSSTAEGIDSPTGQQACLKERLEIRERNGRRLVTLIDVVSPADKLIESSRRACLESRREARDLGANIIEIDLVLQGRPLFEYSREGLPEWDYAVTVCRATQPERYEIYTSTLAKRLPRFRVPLASDDRDTVLDLQATFTRYYDQGGFASKIDYRGDPPVALSLKNEQLVKELLGPLRHGH